MRFVYVLEDDAKMMTEIGESLLSIDPKLQIRQFKSLQSFVDWIKVLMAEGAAAVLKGGAIPPALKLEPLPEGEPPILQLVVSKVEFLGPRQLGLLKKTRDLFVRTGVCVAEDPTAFVLTAFEDPNFHVDELKDRILANILLKPFDRLILQQHLTFALDGRHPPSKHAVAPYKTKAVIEVLKTIEMESLSSIGFTTRSNRPLPPGAVAKYYGKPFWSERQRSLIARLHSCDPHPDVPEEFLAAFTFFGADQTQISNLQRRVLGERANALPKSLFTVKPTGQRKTCRIVFLDNQEEMVQSLESTLKRKIEGATFTRYRNLKEFFMELDPKLDSEPSVKALGDQPFVNLDLDARGKIVKIENDAKPKFGEHLLAPGTAITVFLRDSDRANLPDWLAKPEAPLVLMWNWQDRSHVMKLTRAQGKTFRLEEAGAAEKEAFSRQSSRLAKGWDFLFVSHRFSGVERLNLWKEFPAKGRALGGEGLFKMFMVAAQEYSDEEERQLAHVFDDLFFFPVDRVYVMKKMLLIAPDLKVLDDPIEIPAIPFTEELKSARPAEIEELSEAGLVMKYDRAMSVGSFREFVLWQPYEIGAPEINATCNFIEETSTKNEWKLQFVFFAMKDVLLKAIRNWIKDNYIASKDKG